ncbi:hypothetical protein SDC9_211268 [bioreactor metagenome]|uniref:Uncharacterized protein n=1 Tax=bioreactor metagenome TaxID=1076179 RepID=A0A645JUD8_9ZZZZ
MEQFAHLIKQHDGHALGIVADNKRARRCQTHQEVFIEHLAAQNIADGLQEHIAADNDVSDQKDGQGRQVAAGAKKNARCVHGGAHQNFHQAEPV